MKKLDAYVLRELVVPFMIGTFVIVLMFQANTYIYLAKTFNLDYVPLAARFQYIMYQTPGYMRMTLPIGAAFAASLAVTRLARESELTAMRAAGIRIVRVVAPIAAFGIVVAIGNFLLVEKVIPPATRKANQLIYQTSALGLGVQSIAANVFLKLQRYGVSLGSVRRDPKSDRLTVSDVLLIEKGPAGVSLIVTAPSGSYDRGVWRFPQATLFNVRGADVTGIRARPMIINERIAVEQIFNPQAAEEMSTAELRRQIASGSRTGQNVKSLQVDLYQRFAVPASCAIFAVVAPVFAIFFARSGGFVGVLISFVMVLLYYNAFVISTQILGKLDPVPAWVAAWLPNILFGALGLLAYRRLE